LSPRLVEEVGGIIGRLQEEGVAILLVEQNLHFALSVAQHILIMSKGTILHSGRPQDVASDIRTLQTYLGVGAGAVQGP